MNGLNLDFVTVDVFTKDTFGGNPLAVFFASDRQAASLTEHQMQSIAAEMNYSETTFVLPPVDPANTAHIRIFTPKSELPFAGHPNVARVLCWHPTRRQCLLLANLSLKPMNETAVSSVLCALKNRQVW